MFLLLSCIVVFIRELVNKLFSTSAFNLQSQQMAQLPSNMDINVNIDIIREKSTFSSKFSSRELLTHSTALFVSYHEKMEAQNNFLDEKV